MLFTKLLSDQHLIIFVYSNQLLLINSDFLHIRNLTNNLLYDLHLIVLLTFRFLKIVLYQNK